jgi:hypothetical protein
VQPVAVRILHPSARSTTGPLERSLVDARGANADRLVGLFRAAGADDVRIESSGARAASFGELARRLLEAIPDRAGLVLLGSGSIPLATAVDVAAFVEVARSGARRALANNFYSADVVAIGQSAALGAVPDMPSDNALPRWLAEEAGFEVNDLRRRWRLAVDLDSPIDVLLTRGAVPDVDTAPVTDRLGRLHALTAYPRAELVVAGRTSARTLRWLERNTASRTRMLVEERGLRTMGLAVASQREQRASRSILGLLLDDRGPGALGTVLAELGDAAVVDTRVLLAHRLGADDSAWPAAEDRFASDLLLADRITDPWLRALTASARDSASAVLLGGHTLVGPGVRLAIGRHR